MAKQVLRLRKVGGGAPSHLKVGNAYFEQKRYDEALQEFKEALRLNPSMTLAQIRVGDVYFAEEKFPEALEIYQRVVRENPKLAVGHQKIGNVYLEQSNTPKPSAPMRQREVWILSWRVATLSLETRTLSRNGIPKPSLRTKKLFRSIRS